MKRLLSTTTVLSLALTPITPWPLMAQGLDPDLAVAEDGSILAADGTILCSVPAGQTCSLDLIAFQVLAGNEEKLKADAEAAIDAARLEAEAAVAADVADVAAEEAAAAEARAAEEAAAAEAARASEDAAAAEAAAAEAALAEAEAAEAAAGLPVGVDEVAVDARVGAHLMGARKDGAGGGLYCLQAAQVEAHAIDIGLVRDVG